MDILIPPINAETIKQYNIRINELTASIQALEEARNTQHRERALLIAFRNAVNANMPDVR